jgi:hypothetical protein
MPLSGVSRNRGPLVGVDAVCLREAARSDERTQLRADCGKYNDRVSPTNEVFGHSPIRSQSRRGLAARSTYAARRQKPIGPSRAGVGEGNDRASRLLQSGTPDVLRVLASPAEGDSTYLRDRLGL